MKQSFFLGSISAAMNSSIKRYRKNQPSKWVIVGIILGIIFFAVAFVAICVILRVYRLGGKNKTTDS
jgi:t-SNARE complex subunit (syntaxin)